MERDSPGMAVMDGVSVGRDEPFAEAQAARAGRVHDKRVRGERRRRGFGVCMCPIMLIFQRGDKVLHRPALMHARRCLGGQGGGRELPRGGGEVVRRVTGGGTHHAIPCVLLREQGVHLGKGVVRRDAGCLGGRGGVRGGRDGVGDVGVVGVRGGWLGTRRLGGGEEGVL